MGVKRKLKLIYSVFLKTEDLVIAHMQINRTPRKDGSRFDLDFDSSFVSKTICHAGTKRNIIYNLWWNFQLSTPLIDLLSFLFSATYKIIKIQYTFCIWFKYNHILYMVSFKNNINRALEEKSLFFPLHLLSPTPTTHTHLFLKVWGNRRRNFSLISVYLCPFVHNR